MLKIRIYLDINIFHGYNCVKDKNLLNVIEATVFAKMLLWYVFCFGGELWQNV